MKIGKRITTLILIATMSFVGVGCSSANGEEKSARVNNFFLNKQCFLLYFTDLYNIYQHYYSIYFL